MVRVGSVWRACKERMGDMCSTEAFRGKYAQQKQLSKQAVCPTMASGPTPHEGQPRDSGTPTPGLQMCDKWISANQRKQAKESKGAKEAKERGAEAIQTRGSDICCFCIG